MIEYVNTNPGDVIALHDVLRITFVETPSWLVPDSIASENLAFDIDTLIRNTEGGGYPVVPVSDTTVAPGSLAVTIDFMPPGAGSVTVADAVQAITAGLYGALEFLDSTTISRVERITGAQAGAPGAGVDRGATSQTIEQQLQQTTIGATLGKWFGTATTGLVLVGGVALLLVFAPEIEGLLRSGRK